MCYIDSVHILHGAKQEAGTDGGAVTSARPEGVGEYCQ